jgi:hypothetical protein
MKKNKLLVNVMFAMILYLFSSVSWSGTLISGYNQYTLPAGDDNSSGPISLGFTINFFGTNYNSIYVNNNGNTTFSSPLSVYDSASLALNGTGTHYYDPITNSMIYQNVLPIIAPFAADVLTTGNSGLVTYGTNANGINGHATFGVEWNGVDYYGNNTGSKQNIFQELLVSRTDQCAGCFDIIFNYQSIQWETGNLDGGVNGLGGQSAQVGFSNGTGVPGTFYMLAGSGVPGSFINGGTKALATNTNELFSRVSGQYLFHMYTSVGANPTTAPVPIPSSFTLFAVGLVGLGIARKKAVQGPSLRRDCESII